MNKRYENAPVNKRVLFSFISVMLALILGIVIWLQGETLILKANEGDTMKTTGLNSLELIGAQLNETFSSNIMDYTATVAYEVQSLKVKASAEAGYSIKINDKDISNGVESQSIPLVMGYNLITVTVKDSSDLTSFRIVIKRTQKADILYKEIYRPQFHNSPQINLMNDPNGLVYNEETKEYHLFYQYDAKLKKDTETKCWAHAVSKDLVNWKEVTVAITPDELGEIYSGSAVIDRNNTSGLFDESTPPGARMVALYTYYSGHFGDSEFGIEKQGMAYSVNNGLTWIRYTGNPVIANGKDFKQKYTTGFRDPKVIWYEDASYEKGGIWIMVVAGAQARLFTSPDLINWTYNSVMTYSNGRKPIVSECPDLFSMAVDGDKNNIKWVFCGSDYNDGDSKIFYVVGDLVKDEKGVFKYTAITDKSESLNGNNEVYAMQTFFNDPQGRKIGISWIRDWVGLDGQGTEVKNWLGTHTLPVELKLVTVNGQYAMKCILVDEVNQLRSGSAIFSVKNKVVNTGDANILSGLSGKMYDIEAVFTLGSATEFGFYLRTGDGEKTLVRYNIKDKQLILDRSSSGKTVSGEGVFTMDMEPLNGNQVKLRILIDTSIIDLYGNAGDTMINTQIYPKTTSLGMEFFVTGGDVTIESMDIYKMSSIWTNWQESYSPGNLSSKASTTESGVENSGLSLIQSLLKPILIALTILILGGVGITGYCVYQNKRAHDKEKK